MIDERFDAIVVGAGMAGNAAALTLARRGLKVLQLERGEYSGSKNVQGAILYADMLEKLIPEFREDAPLERHLVEQRFWMMDDMSHTGLHYRSDEFNEERPNRYTIIRAQFDKWFSKKVQEAGAVVLCETTVLELLQDAYGKVIGVRTDRKNGQVGADVVVLAEGVTGLLGTRAGLRKRPDKNNVALAVKEMLFLPQETLEARFNLRGDEGAVIEAVGTISEGMTGMGFIYTNKEFDLAWHRLSRRGFREDGANPIRPFGEIQAASVGGGAHRECGSEGIRRSSHSRGWLQGDPATLRRRLGRRRRRRAAEQRHPPRGLEPCDDLGRLAAEAIFQIKSRRDPMTKENLALYKKMLDESFVMKDLKKYRDMPDLLHIQAQNFFLTYPQLVSKAMTNFLRVDGTPKREKEKNTFRSFLAARSLTGLVGDAVRLARAWR